MIILGGSIVLVTVDKYSPSKWALATVVKIHQTRHPHSQLQLLKYQLQVELGLSFSLNWGGKEVVWGGRY